MTDRNNMVGAKTCLFIFILMVLISFLNGVFTGRFNGDFAGVLITIDLVNQCFVFLFSVLPFVFLWVVYVLFNRIHFHKVRENIIEKRVSAFFIVFLIWSFYVTLMYGVGIMAVSQYSDPGFLTYLIYFTNRIDPFYIGALFILVYRGRYLYPFIILLCILGVLRGGVGVFLYVSLALIIRYNISIFKVFLKRPVLSVVLILMFPLMLEVIFSIRATMRGEVSVDDLTVLQLIIGKLVGRFSSFSNLGMIVQKKDYFMSFVTSMDPLYFVKHFLSAFFGKDMIPVIIPERLLINVFGGDLVDKSYMVSLPGNMYVSSLVSPFITGLNLLLVLFTMISVFIITNLIGFSKSNELAFILLLYPTMSGSALEFAKLLLSLFLIYIILSVCRFKVRMPVNGVNS